MKQVKIRFFDGGYCTHPERMVCSCGSFASKKFPAMFALIEHPERGYILYDTAYSDSFFKATKSYPYRLYAKVTPVFSGENDHAVTKLAKLGIKPEEINYIVISHFHADHAGGVSDFPNAKYIYLKSAYDQVKHLTGLKAVLNGFLPGILPSDFGERSQLIDEDRRPTHLPSPLMDHFENVFDIFGDQSLMAVELPGHARGQIGLYVQDNKQEYFLVADACWVRQNYTDLSRPVPLVRMLFDSMDQYYATINKIHNLHKQAPHLEIIPSHDGTFFRKYQQDCQWELTDLAGERDG